MLYLLSALLGFVVGALLVKALSNFNEDRIKKLQQENSSLRLKVDTDRMFYKRRLFKYRKPRDCKHKKC